MGEKRREKERIEDQYVPTFRASEIVKHEHTSVGDEIGKRR